MTKPLQIARPQIKDARTLSPLELNNIHFTGDHTVLTPENLLKAEAEAKAIKK